MKYIHAVIMGIGLIVVIGIIAFYFFGNEIFSLFYAPTETNLSQGVTIKHIVSEKKSVEVIAKNLQSLDIKYPSGLSYHP